MTDIEAQLYSFSAQSRLAAAAQYRQCPGTRGDPRLPWPEGMRRMTRNWPLHVFGSANAWLMYVAPNPGPMRNDGVEYLPPKEPSLGSTPHPHVAGFAYRSWTRLRTLAAAGFAGVLDREGALVSFMLTNLAPGHSSRSLQGQDFDATGFTNVARALVLCRPRLVVAQNRAVYDIIRDATDQKGREFTATPTNGSLHPRRRIISTYAGHPFLLAEAETHFSQGTSSWSETHYLPLLTREARAMKLGAA
jgi:hypothetical protein